MSMAKPGDVSKPMDADSAFAVTLLATCEITLLILDKRNKLESNRKKKEKRQYWLDIMGKAIEGINMTYDGHLCDKFQNKYNKYHKMVECDMASLLKGYKGE